MCFGPLARVCHWGPLTALAIIKIVTGMSVHCSSMWWPANTIGGVLNTVCFMSLSGLALYNFLSAVFHGPGYLPLKWMPSNDDDKNQLQYCTTCQGYKAPRSHHCRKCGRCVLKMDHHCPWINNCVGWGNHAHFTSFLFFAVIGCFHASVILSCSLYRAYYRLYYFFYGSGGVVYLDLYGIILCVFSLGLAAGVVLAVGMLLFFQVRAIVKNRTGIEDWIVEKAIYRRKKTDKPLMFPYDLGVLENIKQVMNLGCQPVGDGITWEIIKDCDQYTLTREQIEQKNNKRQRTKVYKIVKPASGYWFPISQGLSVYLRPPCTDEPRIRLAVDDTVLVTRWRKYWLFGGKLQVNSEEEENSVIVKGWFPRQCAVEMVESNKQDGAEKKIK